MARYWVIAPYHADRPELWERVWEFDLRNNLISIGWHELGDLTSLDRDTLRSKVEAVFADRVPNIRSLYVNMIWSFCNEIRPGDIIISRKGRKTIAGVGQVTGPAFHMPPSEIEPGSADMPYKTHLPVNWQSKPEPRTLDRVAFGMQTLYEISEQQYQELIGLSDPAPATAIDSDIQNTTEFFLEKYLEEFIFTNFAAIFSDELEIYSDPSEEVPARQYTTDVGSIDILAIELATSSFVIIELKKGREADKVVGQTLRYMGWVAENLAQPDQQVKGLIICREADPKLLYALKMVPNIKLKFYQIDFRLYD